MLTFTSLVYLIKLFFVKANIVCCFASMYWSSWVLTQFVTLKLNVFACLNTHLKWSCIVCPDCRWYRHYSNASSCWGYIEKSQWQHSGEQRVIIIGSSPKHCPDLIDFKIIEFEPLRYLLPSCIIGHFRTCSARTFGSWSDRKEVHRHAWVSHY